MARTSLIVEFWAFLRVRKKWWLLPIVVVMVLVGSLLVFAQGSALARVIVQRGDVAVETVRRVVARARRAVVRCGRCGVRHSAPGVTEGDMPTCRCGGPLSIEREPGEQEPGPAAKPNVRDSSKEDPKREEGPKKGDESFIALRTISRRLSIAAWTTGIT